MRCAAPPTGAVGKLRRRDRVRSVLQLSIISHKQFMVSRALRRHGLKADYFALNVGASTGILDVGYDYSFPASVSPRKRRLLEVYYLWTVLARYDVIHSHFKSLLSADGWEFDYLKRLGKVVVFHYRGCDVRHRSLNLLAAADSELLPGVRLSGRVVRYRLPEIAGGHHQEVRRSVLRDDARSAAISWRAPSTFRSSIPSVSTSNRSRPWLRDPQRLPRRHELNHHGIDGTRFIRDAVERLRREGRPSSWSRSPRRATSTPCPSTRAPTCTSGSSGWAITTTPTSRR